MNGMTTSTRDVVRRSHRRQRERVVSKSHAISDGGGDVRRPRKPSHEKEGFEKEDRSVKEGDLFHHYPRRRRSQARTLIKSIKDNEEPFDFSKVLAVKLNLIIDYGIFSFHFRPSSLPPIRQLYPKRNIGLCPTDGFPYSAATS